MHAIHNSLKIDSPSHSFLTSLPTSLNPTQPRKQITQHRSPPAFCSRRRKNPNTGALSNINSHRHHSIFFSISLPKLPSSTVPRPVALLVDIYLGFADAYYSSGLLKYPVRTRKNPQAITAKSISFRASDFFIPFTFFTQNVVASCQIATHCTDHRRQNVRPAVVAASRALQDRRNRLR